MPSPFLAVDGAVGGGPDDRAVPAHYGEPIAEQRRLERGEALVDLSHRGVVRLDGADRLRLLDSLTTQALGALAPGTSSETLQLDPAGRIEFVARVLDDGTSTWLLVDDPAPVVTWIERMRFRLDVVVTDATDEWATVGALADLPLPAGAPNGVPLTWTDPWGAPTGWSYAAAEEHPSLAWTYRETLVPRDALGDLVGRPVAGTLALDALRIAAWRPGGAELDERSIPHEYDWLRTAVHLAKGCYRGQETVAKVHNLGHPPRRLVLLDLDGSDAVLPEHGAEVVHDGDVVGRVTSAALHHEQGPIALAVVKRRVDSGATLAVRAPEGDIAAAQTVIVPPGAGATVEVPRMPRLAAR